MPADLVTIRRAPPDLRRSAPRRAWQWLGQDSAHSVAGVALSPGERVLLSTRRHWLIPCRGLLRMSAMMPVIFGVSVVLDVVAAGLWWLQMVLWVGTAVHCTRVGCRVLSWRADLLVITNNRMMQVVGVLKRSVSEHRLPHITDSEVRHSVLGRIMGYGTLRIESGGRHDDGAKRELLTHVPHADRIFALIHENTVHTGFQRLIDGALNGSRT